MASITNKLDGRRIVQFVGGDGRRRSVRLGKMSKSDAASICLKIEKLASASITGAPLDRETSIWLAEIGDKLHKRLVRVGLAEPRSAAPHRTLGAVIAEYNDKRQGVKQSTRFTWKQAQDSLTEALGENKPLKDITAGDADDWRQGLIKRKLAEATIRKRTRINIMLFNWAIRRRYIQSNPFTHLPSTSIAGDEKPYVPVETAKAVIDQLPDARWRVLFALGRFAGLRLPSEGLALRWSHVDWDKSKIHVPVPKLEHLPVDKRVRTIPIFDQLRPYLEDAYAIASEGDDRVVAIEKVTDAYLRKVVRKAIERAGAAPWRYVFHALRASCETDLAERYPIHVVARWIGHDIRIAQKHYLRTLDEHFDRAARGEEKAVHFPVQQASEMVRKTPQHKNVEKQKPAVFEPQREFAKSCNNNDLYQVGATGLEPVTSSL